MNIQIIYFDSVDDEMDGNGWNMVDFGSIATRYPTMDDAMRQAERWELPFIVLSRNVSLRHAHEMLGMFVSEHNYWVIVSKQTDDEGNLLYWNNDWGWVDKGSATSFTFDESQTLNLPEGAVGWVEVFL